MHALPEFGAIEAGTLSLSGYRSLLSSLYRFHHTLAAAAEAGAAGLSSSARRLALLRSDMAALGAAAPPPGLALKRGSATFLLGALYVGEGSMLGGRIVARQLDYLFGTSSEGRRFFLGSTQDKEAWRRLLAALEQSGDEAAALDQLVEGAEAAFALFERCLRGDAA